MKQIKIRRILGSGLAAAVVVCGISVSGAAVAHAAPVPAALAEQPDMPAPLDGSSKKSQPGYVRGLDRKLEATDKQFAGKNMYGVKGKPSTKDLKNGGATKKQVVNKLLTTINYFYAGGWDYATSDGASANLTIAKPYLNTAQDYHSLMELAAESADGQQIVEIGTTVSQNLNGDLNAHLFVFHWVNGVGTCYNTCGFVAAGGVPASNLPGATLTPGTAPKYAIQYFDNVWWVASNNQWIGYFPGSIWTGATPSVTFNKMGLGQAFAELPSTIVTPCSDMGTGVLGTPGSATAAAISNWALINPTPSGTANAYDGFAVDTNFSPTPTMTGKFEAALNSGSVRSGRAGGPGWNAAGTGNGTIGGC